MIFNGLAGIVLETEGDSVYKMWICFDFQSAEKTFWSLKRDYAR